MGLGGAIAGGAVGGVTFGVAGAVGAGCATAALVAKVGVIALIVTACMGTLKTFNWGQFGIVAGAVIGGSALLGGLALGTLGGFAGCVGGAPA